MKGIKILEKRITKIIDLILEDEQKSRDLTYNLLLKRLSNPFVKHSSIVYKLYNPKDEDEKAVRRSEFSKKFRMEKDENGNTIRFTDEEIEKIFNILDSSEVPSSDGKKTDNDTLKKLLENPNLNNAELAYRLFKVPTNADEIEKANARSLFYKKRDNKTNDSDVPYKFTEEEASELFSLIRDKKS